MKLNIPVKELIFESMQALEVAWSEWLRLLALSLGGRLRRVHDLREHAVARRRTSLSLGRHLSPGGASAGHLSPDSTAETTPTTKTKPDAPSRSAERDVARVIQGM